MLEALVCIQSLTTQLNKYLNRREWRLKYSMPLLKSLELAEKPNKGKESQKDNLCPSHSQLGGPVLGAVCKSLAFTICLVALP